MTLEQYLLDNINKGNIDFCLRAQKDADENVSFYIHPDGVDGTTLDYYVIGHETLSKPNMDFLRSVTGDKLKDVLTTMRIVRIAQT
jgi:hypothetical protein